MSDKRLLKVLVTPLSSHGHINACHGLCEQLLDRGHRVIFLIDADFAGRLEKYGFEEVFVDNVDIPCTKVYVEEGKEFWQVFMEKNADLYSKPAREQITDLFPYLFDMMFDIQLAVSDSYEKIINDIQPDLIIRDGYVDFPIITAGSIPWVWLFSASPHMLFMDESIPPFFSGLPYDTPEVWEEFRDLTTDSLSPLFKRIEDEHVAKGGTPFGERLHPLSNFLNVYMMPKELRYPSFNDQPENIIGVDCFVRTLPDQQFDIPESIRDKPGGLIFFSMGSFGCANLSMMKRLLDILAQIPHRFIVSKGPLKYDLPGDNMWGDQFVPQTAILPIVDIVITHGGNNTVTETFFYGKKMIVLPTFFDQHDNAQRIEEMGYGKRLNPFTCTVEELSNAIEQLLADDELTEKLNQIGERIRNSTDKLIVADYIESKLCY